MKKSNLIALWVLTFITGAVVGGVGMQVWKDKHLVCPAATACRPQAELLLAQLEDASLPEGLQELTVDNTPKSSAELPSQLVRTNLPEDILLGGEAPAAAEKAAGVVLSEDQNTVVLRAQKPVQQATDGTSITMIEAPVAVKRIQTLDQYKAFKRTARGSYPVADFAKEEVLVLESASNLPDNVFEIVSIQPEGNQLKVVYRVNVFGLDKKTNTHSAQKIVKTAAPVVLEQVL